MSNKTDKKESKQTKKRKTTSAPAAPKAKKKRVTPLLFKESIWTALGTLYRQSAALRSRLSTTQAATFAVDVGRATRKFTRVRFASHSRAHTHTHDTIVVYAAMHIDANGVVDGKRNVPNGDRRAGDTAVRATAATVAAARRDHISLDHEFIRNNVLLVCYIYLLMFSMLRKNYRMRFQTLLACVAMPLLRPTPALHWHRHQRRPMSMLCRRRW